MNNRPSAKDLFTMADLKRRQTTTPIPEVDDPQGDVMYTVIPHIFLHVTRKHGVLTLENVPGDTTNLTSAGFQDGDVVAISLSMRKVGTR